MTTSNIGEIYEKIKGLTYEECVEVLSDYGMTAYVLMEDDQGYPLNFDYDPNRMNLDIVKGKVISCFAG